MFQTFYSLKENPFNITADPSFFFGSKYHNEAIGHLTYGIESRKGIIVFTGEVGTGKTTLCRKLLNQAHKKIKTAFVLNPSFSQIQLLQLINKDLGVQSAKTDKLSLINALNEFLIRETAQGNNVAIIIDESQNLNMSQLEQIRLLSNLETEKEKLLQLILVGQPELLEKLKHQSLRQLNQRIIVRYHMNSLQEHELIDYINHRLSVACADKRLTFTDDAIKQLYKYSKGTPRIINVLCERALLAGFVQEVFTITKEIIDNVARETGYAEKQGSFV